MATGSKVKELEKLRDRALALIPKAMGQGEHDIGHKLIEIAEKLDQKIQGHKAQRRSKKK